MKIMVGSRTLNTSYMSIEGFKTAQFLKQQYFSKNCVIFDGILMLRFIVMR